VSKPGFVRGQELFFSVPGVLSTPLPVESGVIGRASMCLIDRRCFGVVGPTTPKPIDPNLLGRSDQWAYKPADRDHPTQVYNIHATALQILGRNCTHRSVRHDGIDRRLTNVHGQVIKEILA
jgi:hypothetical protein